jgi:hypothetical protein
MLRKYTPSAIPDNSSSRLCAPVECIILIMQIYNPSLHRIEKSDVLGVEGSRAKEKE